MDQTELCGIIEAILFVAGEPVVRGDLAHALNLTLEGDTQMCSMALTTDYIGTANNARYSDPEIDALFQQAGQTNDTKEREALYNEIFSKVQEEAVYGVICNPYLLYAHNSELSCGEIPFEGFYQIYDFSWEA